MPPTYEIGAADFQAAIRADRQAAAQARQARRIETQAALQAARDAFIDHAAEIYEDGATAAAADCDQIEAIADRLIDTLAALAPAFERLDCARDLALHRGGVLTRARRAWTPAGLAEIAAEAIAEDILCDPARRVMTAAVRARTAG